jgi:hypothetical protein
MWMSLLIALVGSGLVCGAGFAADEPAKAAPADYVQAYYFHATYRCKTCTTLEKYSRESIEENFKDQLANNTLRFAEVNFDEPENRHFLQDYGLTYRALVIVGSKADFSNYVKTEVEAMLQEL